MTRETNSNGKRLPEHVVVVSVVNQSRNTTIGIVLRELRSFVLAVLKVQIDGLVGKPKLFQHDGNFPVMTAFSSEQSQDE